MAEIHTEVIELADGAVLVSRERAGADPGMYPDEPSGLDGRLPEPAILGMEDMLSALGPLLAEQSTARPDPNARCDRCGTESLVAAAAEFSLGPETLLSFCGHHTRQYLPELAKAGAVPVTGNRALLWFIPTPDYRDE
ncbi:hypothetical protein LG293_17190 (plasmid) [Citricoccus nitrophenolicus]